MANKTDNYWDKRALKRLSDAEKMSEDYIKQIKKMYDKAFKDIDKELRSVYRNYSKDTGLDVQKLKELLTKSETDKMWKTLQRQGLDKYVKANYKARISRLEKIQAQIYAKAKQIYPKEELANTMCYKGVINDSYYKAVYDTQMGTGYDFGFSKIDDRLLDRLLNERWSGRNYSEIIWRNTDILAEGLSEIVGGGMLSGQSVYKMSRAIRDQFGANKYYAERLVRTEVNHFNNEADAMAYEELGVDYYVFVATLDNRTSQKCRDLDNTKIAYKDKKEGENYPPLHPNCRSKTRGYVDEEVEKNLKRRARNPITGKNELIDNMSYKEWLDKQKIKYGDEAIDKTFKQVRNKVADKKQFNNYSTRLKGSPYVPKDIESFVKLKYNNTNEYKRLTREYRTIGKINKKSLYATRDIDIYYKFRNDNVELTQHSIYDYHERMYKSNGESNYDYDSLLKLINKEPNYYDVDTERDVNYYNKISIVKETDTKEVVSIRKGRLSKKWKKR